MPVDRWCYCKISTNYFKYFELVTSTLEDVAEDLYFYDDYANTLYNKWPRVEAVRATFSFTVTSLMVGSQVLVRVYIKILELCNHVLLLYGGTGGRLRGKFSLYCMRSMRRV